jgi:hypothetical protein
MRCDARDEYKGLCILRLASAGASAISCFGPHSPPLHEAVISRARGGWAHEGSRPGRGWDRVGAKGAKLKISPDARCRGLVACSPRRSRGCCRCRCSPVVKLWCVREGVPRRGHGYAHAHGLPCCWQRSFSCSSCSAAGVLSAWLPHIFETGTSTSPLSPTCSALLDGLAELGLSKSAPPSNPAPSANRPSPLPKLERLGIAEREEACLAWPRQSTVGSECSIQLLVRLRDVPRASQSSSPYLCRPGETTVPSPPTAANPI